MGDIKEAPDVFDTFILAVFPCRVGGFDVNMSHQAVLTNQSSELTCHHCRQHLRYQFWCEKDL